MFIRTKTSGGRKYSALVESYHDPKTGRKRQRLLVYLGAGTFRTATEARIHFGRLKRSLCAQLAQQKRNCARYVLYYGEVPPKQKHGGYRRGDLPHAKNYWRTMANIRSLQRQHARVLVILNKLKKVAPE